MQRTPFMVGAVLLLACSGSAQEQGHTSEFADVIARLSEPAGFFDTDNLISNERSYLHVIPTLERLGVEGGAYIGVGPDQNFSYVAAVRPRVAYMVDIRRDNLLLHLVFKALFEMAPTRIEYLCLLFARPLPDTGDDWGSRSIEELAAHVDSSETRAALVGLSRARVDSAIATFRVPLSDLDWSTIDRFHRVFIREGLSLRFTSYGRSARFYYPNYGELLKETTVDGDRRSYLTTAVAYQTVRDLQLSDRVIPVVGDLAGHDAVRAVARHISDLGLEVSAFYTSNVEFYLFQAGTFDAFVRNTATLPRNDRSVVIRSLFRNPGGGGHPKSVPGHYSTQLVQTIDDLIEGYRLGEIRSYLNLVMRFVPD